jgi:hypothetical protein
MARLKCCIYMLGNLPGYGAGNFNYLNNWRATQDKTANTYVIEINM